MIDAPEAFLYARLTSQTSVSSLVGTKIFPLIAPTGTALPLVIYQRVGVQATDAQSLAGPLGGRVVTMQFTSYDTSYTSVKTIARALRLQLDGWTGTTGSVTIQRTILQSEADGVDMPQDDQMLPFYNVSQTFDFRVFEAT
jgi:hypothetical protein